MALTCSCRCGAEATIHLVGLRGFKAISCDVCQEAVEAATIRVLLERWKASGGKIEQTLEPKMAAAERVALCTDSPPLLRRFFRYLRAGLV